MPVEIVLDDRELRQFRAALGEQAFGAAATEELRAATVESLTFAERFLAKSPPRPVSFRAKFVSAKQRRWFFWALRSGAIQVPYRRTGTLGRRWRHLITPAGGGIRGTLTNRTPYAEFVQDEKKQARVHAGRWPTIQMTERGTVARKFPLIYGRALQRLANRLAAMVRR